MVREKIECLTKVMAECSDRVDKSALGWDHKEKLQMHDSQKDYKTG